MQLDILRVSPEVEERQLARLKKTRSGRDEQVVAVRLEALEAACLNGENTFPHILDAVRAYASVGEICETMKSVFGAYEEASIL